MKSRRALPIWVGAVVSAWAASGAGLESAADHSPASGAMQCTPLALLGFATVALGTGLTAPSTLRRPRFWLALGAVALLAIAIGGWFWWQLQSIGGSTMGISSIASSTSFPTNRPRESRYPTGVASISASSAEAVAGNPVPGSIRVYTAAERDVLYAAKAGAGPPPRPG